MQKKKWIPPLRRVGPFHQNYMESGMGGGLRGLESPLKDIPQGRDKVTYALLMGCGKGQREKLLPKGGIEDKQQNGKELPRDRAGKKARRTRKKPICK